MARIRSVKPEFWEDEEVGSLSIPARLLFIATWNMADDEGLLRWAAPYVKSNAFMYDDDLEVEQVAALMAELEEAGSVVAYRGGKNQQALGWIPSFPSHQKPNRPQPSKLAPPNLENTTIRRVYVERDNWICHICGEDIPRITTSNSYDRPDLEPKFRALSLDHVVPRSAGGTDYPSNIRAAHAQCNSRKGSSVPDSEPESLNDSLNDSADVPVLFTPVVEGRGDVGVGEVEVAPPARRTDPDAVFEAVAEVCGIDWRNDLTRVARGQLNAAVGALKQVNATPDEIRRRAVNYRIEYPRNTLTPSALAKHWPQLARTTTKVSASTAAILGTP